ncbi:uncharacterized protein [Macrobrachium rosenbergii]|uniref:uncharacterized protein n=1 Tax=Macrobrachium rosenbergii TaxID=79674 RepID=UPI0034D3FC62
MAEIPSHYYGNYSEHQQVMSENCHSSYPGPFAEGNYACNSPAINLVSQYSPTSYQPTFSPAPTPPFQNPYCGQSYCEQSPNFPLNSVANPFSVNRNTYLNNQRIDNVKTTNDIYERRHSFELGEPLDEIPVESLLHISKQEGQLISESEAEDASSDLCLSISRHNDFSSVLTPDSDDFLFGADRDEEDSRSTMYSMNSTSDSAVSAHSIGHGYDHSNTSSTSPNLVSSCMKSPFELGNFTDSLIPSQSYTQHSNQAIMNPSPASSNISCDNLNNSFLTSNSHVSLESGQMVGFPQVSPKYSQSLAQNYIDPFMQNKEQDLKMCEANSMKKKPKQVKKAPKEEQGGPKISKKPKVSDAPKFPVQASFNEVVVNTNTGSPNTHNLTSHIGAFDEELLSGDNSDPDYPGSEDSSAAPQPKTVEPQRIVRKRMRCPRGMTLEIKPCEVCGDKAKNMHFGGLVCDSCKAFFRRSVQSNAWDQFKCEKEGNCSINKANRRCCQYCRFQKCEKVGMKMDWVMTESGRMNLFKNRLARTRQMKEEKKKEKLYGDLPKTLSFDDAFAIKKILDTLHMTFGSMPYPEECKGDSIDSLSNIFVYLCKRFGKFFLKITEDTDLCEEDKTLLLKNGISMSLYINGAHMYDPVTRSWPATTTHESIKVPHLTLETLEKLATIPDAFSTIMKFYGAYEGDLKDHVVAALMYLISFFLPDDPSLIDCTSVQKIQNEYVGYLKRYLVARDGQKSVSGIFRKLLDGINYVKDILKYHTMVDIKPTIDHTSLSVFAKDAIAQSMANLLTQIEMSFKQNFPPYASILKEEEKEALGMGSHSTTLVKKESGAVMPNHPDTIAMFGATTRTDQLVVHPLLKMIEWNKADPRQSSRMKPSLEGNPASEAGRRRSSSSSSSSDTEEALAGGNPEEVDVDAVCDILKKLSHTDDVKMINIFKENIPKELLEKFSRDLTDHQS